ncbi:MAG: DUF6293 family protein [Candidatus Thermoplasmatota archaeon]|nr:DUF6293 family protein [Candidatus Thermoplasmatota archaeon]
MRVVISCVTFETVKIVEPIKHFKADRAYLLHRAVKQPYVDFLNDVKRQLETERIEQIPVEVNINDFQEVLKILIDILERENREGNHVYVNIEAGSAIYSSASLLASLMENGIPFNVGTREQMIKDTKIYYENERPVGMAKKVHDPFILPEFKLQRPNEKLVEGLKIWIEINKDNRRTRLSETIMELQGKGILEDCLDDRGKVTHRGQMSFIRKLREKWIKKGWMRKNEDNTFSITSYGRSITSIF